MDFQLLGHTGRLTRTDWFGRSLLRIAVARHQSVSAVTISSLSSKEQLPFQTNVALALGNLEPAYSHRRIGVPRNP